ncbi:MAG: DUF504 domain-containing protein [Candidatus Aenigmarchaeota archaeon]|nr:DUF504 domain-containing protein [Candidatus Aenigmarchaeota archaeon]
MIPIQKLLNKIQWDESLDPNDFEIGIYDRVSDDIFYRPFDEIRIRKGDKFSFSTVGEDGKEHEIPFHRIKVVLEKGKVVWQRPEK